MRDTHLLQLALGLTPRSGLLRARNSTRRGTVSTFISIFLGAAVFPARAATRRTVQRMAPNR